MQLQRQDLSVLAMMFRPRRRKGRVMGKVLGVDLSNNNGNVDPSKLQTDFVFHKATEGLTFVDQDYAHRGTILLARGIPFGPYHYARVHEDPAAQVGHFLNVAKLHKGMLVPFVDVEGQGNEGATGQQWRDWLAVWFHEMVGVHNRRCGIYVSPGFADTYNFGEALWLRAFYLFVAHWNVPKPRIPAPWNHATIWQYSDNTRVPGESGPVDGDEWLDPFEAWRVER